MKKDLRIPIILICIVFAFSSAIAAQEGRGEGRLRGYVLDTDKNPIEGAKVTLEYLKYDRKLVTTTNKKGKFSFLGLAVGDVRISAEKEGFVLGGNQTRVSGAQKNPTQYIKLKRESEAKPKEDPNAALKDEFAQAIALFNDRKFEEALGLFQSFQEKKPDMYKIGINIGNCYVELQRYKEAIEEFQKVLDKITAENPVLEGNKTAAQIYATIGDIYMRQDQLKKAEEYFKKSIEIDKSDHALAYNVAEILFVGGKTDDSIKYYNLAIKIKPDWPKSYKQIGYAYLNKGDMKKAIEMFKKFLKLDPDSPEASGIKEVIKSLEL